MAPALLDSTATATANHTMLGNATSTDPQLFVEQALVGMDCMRWRDAWHQE
jgi:hypothetical protein